MSKESKTLAGQIKDCTRKIRAYQIIVACVDQRLEEVDSDIANLEKKRERILADYERAPAAIEGAQALLERLNTQRRSRLLQSLPLPSDPRSKALRKRERILATMAALKQELEGIELPEEA